MCTNTNNTILIQVFGSVLTYVKNIGGKFLHTTLGLAHLKKLLNHVNRGVHILADDTLAQHDSILIVVTFPWDISHFQVLTESQLTTLGSISLCEDLSFLYTVALADNRVKVNRCILVGLLKLRQFVFFLCRLERDKLLFLRTIVLNTNHIGIYIGYQTCPLCLYLCATVFYELLLDTGSDDRCFASNQRYCLAHHVRTHQCTVSIIVLQERNQSSSHRRNLAWCHIHQIDLLGRNNGKISPETRFNLVADKLTILVQRSITLCYNLLFLVLCTKITDMLIVQIHNTVLCLTIRSLNETEVVDFGIDTKRRNQTDIRTLRRLNRAKTTIVCIVYVSNLETGTVATQTTGTKSRHTTLVSNLCQGVLLVHKLAQRIGAEIGINNRRDRLRIDKVGRRKYLIIAHVHTLTHGTRHTRQTYAKLIVELFPHSANATVRQVVDIVHFSIGVNQFDQIFDNLDNILFCQNTNIIGNRHIQLTVDTVATYLTEVITLLREEQVLNHLACRCIIGRLCITQLTIDIENSLFLGFSRVFLESIEDNRVVALTILILVEKHRLTTRLHNDINHIRCQFGFTLYHNLVTLNRRNLPRILIYEILQSRFHHISSQATTYTSLQFGAVALYFLCQVEATEDIFIRLKADSTEQRGNRQFLLTVDVSIHYLVDVGSKLNP